MQLITCCFEFYCHLSIHLQVDEWYGSYELMHKEEEVVIKRRVYIATDEPKVLKEASDK